MTGFVAPDQRLDGVCHVNGLMLVSASEPLARLQQDHGGTLPGPLAIAALRPLVKQCHELGLKLSRPLHARTAEGDIAAWLELWPHHDAGEAAVHMRIAQWKSTPIDDGNNDPALDLPRKRALLLAQCDGVLRLDQDQRILGLDLHGPALAALESSAEAWLGRYWTLLFRLPQLPHRPVNGSDAPLHWRILDGSMAQLPGCPGEWTAHLLPLGPASDRPGGFDLLLVPTRPVAAAPAIPPVEAEPVPSRFAMLGQQLAPLMRQPIGRIIAKAETIGNRMEGPIRAEYAGYAGDIAQAARHLMELLEDFSDLEAVESARFSPARDRIDLADIARRAAGLLALKANERQISIDCPKEGESLPAIGEFRRVLQIVLNLVTNAIRYTPAQSQIWLRIDDSGPMAMLIVADQGEGIAHEDQARVFDKFERLGRSGDGGSGLGLYISRKLARAMGGDLQLESAPGQGARFVLSLPIDSSAS